MRAVLLACSLVCACRCSKTTDGDGNPVAAPAPVAPVPIKPAAPEPAPEAAQPVAVPVAPPPVFPIDKLSTLPADAPAERVIDDVRRAVREVAPELGLTDIDVLYVRKDGTLDPTYGSLRIVLALSDAPDGVVDDPARPTGAPIPEPTAVEQKRTSCPTLTFAKGVWSVQASGCRKAKRFLEPCSITGLWTRALAAGAPADAVATLRATIALDFWTFRIVDKVRKVEFQKYLHDCAPPAAPRPD